MRYLSVTPAVPLALSFAAGLFLTTLVGCVEPPSVHCRDTHAREVVLHRNEAVLYAPRRYAASEASRPQKLAYTAGRVDKVIRTDAEKAARLPESVVYYVDRDLRRWMNNQPVYLGKAVQTLSGKPSAIPANAVLLFY